MLYNRAKRAEGKVRRRQTSARPFYLREVNMGEWPSKLPEKVFVSIYSSLGPPRQIPLGIAFILGG